MTLPMLQGWGDTIKDNLPQLGSTIAQIISPNAVLQKNLQGQIALHPELAQQLANLEAQNPGALSHLLGNGKTTDSLLQLKPDTTTSLDMATKGSMIKQVSSDAGKEEYAAKKTGTQTTAARALQQQTITKNAQDISRNDQEIQSNNITLQKNARRQELLKQFPQGITADNLKSLPASDQSILADDPYVRNVIEKQMLTQERLAQQASNAAISRAASAEQRQSILDQTLAQKKDMFTTRTYLDAKANGGQGFTIKDMDMYLNNGGDDALQQAMQSPQAAQLLQTPQLSSMLAISNALGNKGGAKVAEKLEPQISTVMNHIAMQLSPPKALGKNSKQIPVDMNAVMPNVQALQALYDKQAKLSGDPLKKVTLDRIGGQVSLRTYNSTGNQNIDSYAAMLPQQRTVALQKLKAQNPEAYKFVVDALTKAGSFK